jgi:hypothetical protein
MANNDVNSYLEKTGQTLKELYEGAGQYSTTFIHDLVKQALENNKKLVWIPDPKSPPLSGLLLYRFEDF